MALSMENWAEIYKAMADKTRLHILALLKHDEMCVCELVEVLKMTQPAISQHLRKLKQVGLVKERKKAQWVYYALEGYAVPFFNQCVDELPDVSEEIEWLEMQGLRVRICCDTGPQRGVTK